MEWMELSARERRGLGKGSCRKLRSRNEVPAILYGGDGSPLPLAVSRSELKKVMERGGGENAILRLSIQHDGEELVKTAMIKDVQIHPVRGEYLHVDFLRISLEKPIRVKVPISLRGEAPGVKVTGGILDQALREVEVECLPAAIPASLVADISSLQIGDSIHVSDLESVEGVKILESPEIVVASVVPPEREEEVVAPEVTPAEPEVVSKKEPREEREKE